MARKATTEDFVLKAKEVHGDKYTFEESIYVDIHTKLKVTCKLHGVFEIRPTNLHQGRGCKQRAVSHCQGYGCPKCATTGFDQTKPSYFYVLSDGDYTKIGITNRQVQARVNQINNSGKNFKIITYIFAQDGKVIQELEKSCLKALRGVYNNPTEKFDGRTETFVDVCHSKLFELMSEAYQ